MKVGATARGDLFVSDDQLLSYVASHADIDLSEHLGFGHALVLIRNHEGGSETRSSCNDSSFIKLHGVFVIVASDCVTRFVDGGVQPVLLSH